jgi:hypothetical protein
VKLDCEGAEGEIIEWICAHLTALSLRIEITEYHHSCPIAFERLLQLLRESGFAAEHRRPFDESYIFATRA